VAVWNAQGVQLVWGKKIEQPGIIMAVYVRFGEVPGEMRKIKAKR